MCCACAVATAATVYKWVDENGVTHYSDQPHQSAAKVDVQKQPPIGSVATPSPAVSAASAPAAERVYTSCEIASPMADEVFQNTFTVTAQLNVQPTQRGGDQVVISLDGKPVPGLPTVGTQFKLDQVDRGTHSLQASIQDNTGRTVCQSASVTFHVRQPNLLSPNRTKH